jgi:hypothetical protein
VPSFETLPGESMSSIISSIINLVCPHCGGSMMEFQCNGKCRRNWFSEWERVNFGTAILAREVVRPNGELRIRNRELGYLGYGCLILSTKTI